MGRSSRKYLYDILQSIDSINEYMEIKKIFLHTNKTNYYDRRAVEREL